MSDPFKPKPNSKGKIAMVSPYSNSVIYVDENKWDHFRNCDWVSAAEYYRQLWREAEKSKAEYCKQLRELKNQMNGWDE